MKTQNTILTILSLVAASSSAFAARPAITGGGHTEGGITLQQIQTYERQGYDVSIGEVFFNAGPSQFQIPGTSVCSDGTFLRAGKIQVCEDGSDGTNVSDCAADDLVTYDLKTPIHYRELETVAEGGMANSDCPSGSCYVSRTMPNGVYVTVGSNNGGGAGEGGPASDIANTSYVFPACAQ